MNRDNRRRSSRDDDYKEDQRSGGRGMRNDGGRENSSRK